MDLRSYRRDKKWTLEEVAHWVGLSNASIVRRHELGHHMPSPATIEKYRKLTGGQVTADDFARTAHKYRKANPRPKREVEAA